MGEWERGSEGRKEDRRGGWGDGMEQASFDALTDQGRFRSHSLPAAKAFTLQDLRKSSQHAVDKLGEGFHAPPS